MSKSQNRKKNSKKEPAKTKEEKRVAKREKRDGNSKSAIPTDLKG